MSDGTPRIPQDIKKNGNDIQELMMSQKKVDDNENHAKRTGEAMQANITNIRLIRYMIIDVIINVNTIFCSKRFLKSAINVYIISRILPISFHI